MSRIRRATSIVGPRGDAAPFDGDLYVSMPSVGSVIGFTLSDAGVAWGATSPLPAPANVMQRYLTGVQGPLNGTGFRISAQDLMIRTWGFKLAWRYQRAMVAATTPRGFCGVGEQNAFSQISTYDPVTGGVNRLRIGLACNDPTGNYSLVSADGAALFSQNLGAAFPSDPNTAVELTLTCSASAPNTVFAGVKNIGTGARTVVAMTANLPPAATLLRLGIAGYSTAVAGIDAQRYVYMRGYISNP